MEESQDNDDAAAPAADSHLEAVPAPNHQPERRRWWRLRWVFTRRLCFGGLAGGLVLFCFSMTPSLVPRSALMQGVVSGMSVAMGYGLGSFASAAIRRFIPSEPSSRIKRTAWWGLALVAPVVVLVFVLFGAGWQTDLRRLMGMEALGATSWLTIVLLTLVTGLFILLIARLIRGLTRGVIGVLDRFMPHQATVIVSLAVVAIVLIGFAQGVLFKAATGAMNEMYSLGDKDTSAWISRPTSTIRSGGPDSLVAWDSLGKKGRDFTGEGGGPTAAEIEDFTGRAALEPVRVYVGLRSADSLDERVDLALAELERTGAFSRSVVVVNTTTGTGWVDENVADSIEFLHDGDTAQVALQYSYLPSWVSFLVDRSKAEETGEQLITAVVDRVQSIPAEDRPTLLLFGESLGSYGTEAAFTSPENMLSNVDGAMLVGPTFVNPLHEELTAERDGGSPVWRPVVDGGNSFRFAVEPNDLVDDALVGGGTEWQAPKVVYLQNSSDPITYFDPALILSPPEWMGQQRGPDVSGGLGWYPFVTFFQVAADMAFAMSVPDGHGHRYGSNVVEGWVQSSGPEDWTERDTAALRQLIDERAESRQLRKEAGG